MLLANVSIHCVITSGSLTVKRFNRRPRILKQTKNHSISFCEGVRSESEKRDFKVPVVAKAQKIVSLKQIGMYSYFIQHSREVSWAPIQSELSRENMHLVSQLSELRMLLPFDQSWCKMWIQFTIWEIGTNKNKLYG